MADILAGDSRVNTIMGMGGDDKIYGGPGGGDDILHGGMGDDMLFGGIGNDDIHGDAGDDMLNGGAGADDFYGGAGSDTIYADRDDTTINGWLADQVDDTDTPDIDESVEAEVDPMTADTVSYEKVVEGQTGITATLSAGVISNVENIIGSPLNDTLTGDAGDNVIEGGDGADALDGREIRLQIPKVIPSPTGIPTRAFQLPLIQPGQVRPSAVMPRETRLATSRTQSVLPMMMTLSVMELLTALGSCR